MKTSYLSAFVGLLLFSSCEKPPVKEYSIIPQPQEINYTPGFIKLDNDISIAFNEDLEPQAQLLSEALQTDFKIKSKFKEGCSSGDIILAIDSTVLPQKEEGYQLDMSKRRIIIKSSTPQGILNGIETLRQTIRENDGKLAVQKAVINDYPTYSWRAFMLDESRHFKGKEVVKILLDQMAEFKMNVFHWHLTDDQGWRIEIKKYPELVKIGSKRDSTEMNNFNSNIFDGKPHIGYYTQEDIKEIVKYAASRNITIVPEIEMPGHASAAIASYPWLGATGKDIKVPCKFGVQYNVYNVADPKVLQFLEDVMDEVIALFPSPVFHIGGDEVRYDQWKSSSMVKEYMKKNNIISPAALQVFFTNNISNLLASKHRRMMGWNEITGKQINDYQQDGSAASNHKLAPETIVHFWKGEPSLIKETITDGYDVVNSYHAYTYLDYPYSSISLEKAYKFNPMPEGLTEKEQQQVLGLGCQMWGEFIPTANDMYSKVFPRIAAYAETGWSGEKNKDYERFIKSLEYFTMRWSAAGLKYGTIK